MSGFTPKLSPIKEMENNGDMTSDMYDQVKCDAFLIDCSEFRRIKDEYMTKEMNSNEMEIMFGKIQNYVDNIIEKYMKSEQERLKYVKIIKQIQQRCDNLELKYSKAVTQIDLYEQKSDILCRINTNNADSSDISGNLTSEPPSPSTTMISSDFDDMINKENIINVNHNSKYKYKIDVKNVKNMLVRMMSVVEGLKSLNKNSKDGDIMILKQTMLYEFEKRYNNINKIFNQEFIQHRKNIANDLRIYFNRFKDSMNKNNSLQNIKYNNYIRSDVIYYFRLNVCLSFIIIILFFIIFAYMNSCQIRYDYFMYA